MYVMCPRGGEVVLGDDGKDTAETDHGRLSRMNLSISNRTMIKEYLRSGKSWEMGKRRMSGRDEVALIILAESSGIMRLWYARQQY